MYLSGDALQQCILSLIDETKSLLNQIRLEYVILVLFSLTEVGYIRAVNLLTLLFCTWSISPKEFLALLYLSPQIVTCHCVGFGDS